MVLNFIDPLLKKYHSFDKIPSKDEQKAYFNDRNILRVKTKDIMSVYREKWNEIENDFESIIDMMEENFEGLEEDPTYAYVIDMIDNINDEAGIKIDKLIKEVAKLLGLTFSAYSNEKFIEEKNKIIGKFKIDMDKIYDDIIMSKNLKNTLFETVSSLFENEKAQNMLLLQLDSVVISLRSL